MSFNTGQYIEDLNEDINQISNNGGWSMCLISWVNADAACQRRGIIALTNSISARQR